MSNDIEVLACPFCGSKDISDGEVLTAYPTGKQTKQSMCNSCKALGAEALLDDGETDYGDVKAVAAWNTRAALAAPQQFIAQADINPDSISPPGSVFFVPSPSVLNDELIASLKTLLNWAESAQWALNSEFSTSDEDDEFDEPILQAQAMLAKVQS